MRKAKAKRMVVRKAVRREIWRLCVIAAGVLMLSACGKRGEERAGGGDLDTPLKAVTCTMESLKELDLETFNECTDNYVSTQRNWIGVPVRREYRVFSELQQPGFRGGKHYEANRRLAEKLVEHMTWEIRDVRQDGDKAEIDLEISNIDMQSVVGYYEIRILENMLESEGSSIVQLVKDLADLAEGKDDLIEIMDTLDTDCTCTMEVTVSAYRTNGQWEIHVSDEFINAFMGNMMGEDYPLEIEQKIEELMEENERKMEEWGEELEEKAVRWAEQF